MWKRNEPVLFYSNDQISEYGEDVFKEQAYLGVVIESEVENTWTISNQSLGLEAVPERYMRRPRETSFYNLIGGSGKNGNIYVYLFIAYLIYTF